ncbi:MAG TPA: hypothetical protein PJ987_10540 [Bacteroidia bacterium]|nr:hypothetical protein [Bacteroidia bacterium]
MDLNDQINFLNFWIAKERGQFYTIPELENLLDYGQMSVFDDLHQKYATSQRIKDALIPFKEIYNFTTLTSGYVIVPDSRYLKFLDLQIYYNISDRRVYYPVKLINEDERADRLNSQIDPVTSTSPIGEQTAVKTFRLYPAHAYNGNVTYLRRPVKPVFGYNVISGRVIVYNPATSTQLEWGQDWINTILIKALKSIGINIKEADVSGFAEAASQANYTGLNMM